MSETLTMVHEDGETKGGFFLKRGDEVLGEMTYSHAGETNLIFDRTWVDDSLRGQGRAGELMNAAMEWVKATGHKVVPVCSYVVAQFEKRPELAELRA